MVSFGDAGDKAGDAATAMIYSEVPGGHLLPLNFVQRMGRGQALAARGPARAQAWHCPLPSTQAQAVALSPACLAVLQHGLGVLGSPSSHPNAHSAQSVITILPES